MPTSRHHRLLFALFSSLTVLTLLGSVSAYAPRSASGAIKIYVSLPLQNPQGASTHRAIELALKQTGERAGDFQIVLVSKTDGDESGNSVGASEEANAREAVADPDVMVYIGPLDSDMAHISIPITNRGGLAQISPSNTAPDLTKTGFSPGRPGEFYPTGRRNYFRTCPTDDAQGPAAAAWAREMGYQSVYILDDGEVYGAGVADQFELKANDVGIAVLGRETIDATDISAVLSRIAEADPDLVYYGGYTENGAPLVITQMREMALRADFMVPDGAADAQFLEKAGASAEGVWSTLVGMPPAQLSGEVGRGFYTAYKAEYGEEPDTLAQFGYDAARVVLAAIERTQAKDRKAILEAIAATRNFPGTGGAFSFDRNGDTTLIVISGNRVRNGKFEFVRPLDPGL